MRGSSPPIEHIFGKTEQSIHLEACSIIEYDGAREMAKHLVLNGFEQSGIDIGLAVYDGRELHLEASVRARKSTRFRVVARIEMERDLGEFMGHTIDKQHILRSWCSVRKPIPNVPPQHMFTHAC